MSDEVLVLTNYRSQAGLVEVVNQLFVPVFGTECALEPVNLPKPCGVERWLLQSQNKSNDAIALACGVAGLLDEGIDAGEVAVVAHTNNDGKAFADAMGALGISAVMELPGLFNNRECALVLAGLRVVADRYDSLATATGTPGSSSYVFRPPHLLKCERMTGSDFRHRRRSNGGISAPNRLYRKVSPLLRLHSLPVCR